MVLIHHHYDHHHHHHHFLLLLLLLLLQHHLVFLLVVKIFVDVGDFFPIKLGMIFVHLILYPMDEHLTRNEDIRNRYNGLEHLTLGMRILGIGTMD